jgi:hypothetical protein
MKKLLLLPAFLVILSSVASAQVKVGVKAGGNYSNISILNFNRFGETKYKPGFHAGAFMVLWAGKEYAVRQEFLYNVKGWKYADSIQTEAQHLNYLNQSVLLYLKLIPKFSLLLGPEVGYLLSIRPKNDGPHFPEFHQLDINAFNRFEASLIGGIAYQVAEQLSLEARYTLGFSKVLAGNNEYGNNQVFQVSMGYTFEKKSDLNKLL